MRRIGTLARVLWSATALASCGRLGFEGLEGPIAALDTAMSLTSVCGAMAAPSTFAIRNTGDVPLVIVSTEVTGGFAVATTLPLTIDPGASGALIVVPPLAVIGSDLAGATKSGTLSIVTNEPGATHQVALTTSVVGANLSITDVANTPITVLAFSASSGACPTPQTVVLHNDGNAPITFDAGSSLAFLMSGFSGGVLAAGASVMVDVRVGTASPCVGTDSITYLVTGNACTTTPTVLMASFNITGASTCSCS